MKKTHPDSIANPTLRDRKTLIQPDCPRSPGVLTARAYATRNTLSP